MFASDRSTYNSPIEHGFKPRFLISQNNALMSNPPMFPDPQGSNVPVMEMSVGSGCVSSWVSAAWGGGFQHRLKPLLCSRAFYTRQDWICPWVVSDRIWSWGKRDMPGWHKMRCLSSRGKDASGGKEIKLMCGVWSLEGPFLGKNSPKLIQRSSIISTARNPTFVFNEQPLAELQTSLLLLSYDMGMSLNLLFVISFSFCFSDLKKARTKAETLQ